VGCFSRSGSRIGQALTGDKLRSLRAHIVEIDCDNLRELARGNTRALPLDLQLDQFGCAGLGIDVHPRADHPAVCARAGIKDVISVCE